MSMRVSAPALPDTSASNRNAGAFQRVVGCRTQSEFTDGPAQLFALAGGVKRAVAGLRLGKTGEGVQSGVFLPSSPAFAFSVAAFASPIRLCLSDFGLRDKRGRIIGI